MKPSALSRRAFTLIELLTVIAIIGILAAILIPTVGKVRESSKRAKCMSNVRQIGLSLIAYANGDKLQRFPAYQSGAWAWDMHKDLVKLLVGNSGREVIYCPSGMPNDNDEMWQFNGTFAVSNYVVLIPGVQQIPQPVVPLTSGVGNTTPNSVAAEDQSLINIKIKPAYTYKNESFPPSQRVLVTDTIMRTGRDNYTDIAGGLKGNRTNHLNSAQSTAQPSGGNLSYVDGHVAWRPFDKMAVRTTGTPTFLW